MLIGSRPGPAQWWRRSPSQENTPSPTPDQMISRKKCGDVDCAADDDDDGNNFAPGILWCHYLCYLIR